MKRKKRLRRKEYLALERKKKDRQNKVLTGLFLALVFGGTAATFLVPKREFSDRENRALQQFPKASVDSVQVLSTNHCQLTLTLAIRN